MGFTLENIDEICKDICDGCPLIVQVDDGRENGEQINPPEYDCLINQDPLLQIVDDEVICGLREQHDGDL